MSNKRVELNIEGMHCDACVKGIRNALLENEGVLDADVSIGRAEITYDDALISMPKLVQAVQQAGEFSLSGFHTL